MSLIDNHAHITKEMSELLGDPNFDFSQISTIARMSFIDNHALDIRNMCQHHEST